MIRFEHVFKRYDKRTVIQDVSFEIQKGELVVLIGPSGCGKTTLLKMINRLIKPSSGEIYINGKSIESFKETQLRRNIGYVIQQTGLFPHMTVKENISIILRLNRGSSDEIQEKCLELMNMVGLEPDEFLDRFPAQLSGGQQQRVGVARAFACNPDIILMDEPFSALDPITRNQLQDELVDLQSRVHKTIVFVTHDMDEAVKIADRICILNNGCIVGYDTPEELMKNTSDEFAEEFMGKNRIWSSPEYIRAKDIMIQNPVCAPPDVTALRCIEKMRTEKVDRLLIVDKKKKLLGIATAKSVQAQADKKTPVSLIMRTEFEQFLPSDNIIHILQVVNEKQLSAIPVVDEDGILNGLITRSSLVTALSQQYIDISEVN